MSHIQIVVPSTNAEMVHWCREQFGVTRGLRGRSLPLHEMRWYCRVTRFYFKDEKDAVFFSLRWL